MSRSDDWARVFSDHTAEVLEHHRDAGRPGKPLRWLIPGGVVALLALVGLLLDLHSWLYERSISPERGLQALAILAPFYLGGVFVFSYGYELYDLPKALRLTGIIVVTTIAALIIIAVLLILLREEDGAPSRSASRASPQPDREEVRINPDFEDTSRDGKRTAESPADRVPQTHCTKCGHVLVLAGDAFVCPDCDAAQVARAGP